ncbi:winged helix DNA-binding protein [Kineococcus rhizosphaerae]|uniref:Winged helix DNA-binding protein n=1 Tax=Kineococcus rhizosphaerae TaxID=559628 RepID=A0A2T0R1S0_9ACTN|nr:winged helix DNA-binding protein [Kineococcus rhizosphaerae]
MSDDERRARLAVRHALASGVASPEEATRAVTVLHATEPATVHLSCWARVPGLAVADVERALYADRTLVKQLAMRRTLFVVPRDLLPAVLPSASARVAATERAAVVKDVVTAGLAVDGNAWLDAGRAQVIDLLGRHPAGLPAQAVREAVPAIDVKVSVRPGSQWSASRVLTHLGLTGDVVRGANSGHWRVSRPAWTLTRDWIDPPVPWSAADGYREVVRRWLWSFGPGTEDDLVWWLGATKGVVRTALAGLGAVAVRLDDGSTGWLLPEDEEVVADPGPWVALLPVLDPTVMGWKERGFHLGPHRERLFDRNGNAGTTVWVDGRVVGCWVQDAAGVVHLRLLERVGARARRALSAEAERLTAWLGGVKVGTVYSSPAMKDPVVC